MAMSATGSAVNVGSYGKIRVLVNVRTPQDVGNNRSVVRVRGQMALRQGSPSYNNNNIAMSVAANPGGGSKSSPSSFSVPSTAWVTVIDEDITVNHAADGTRTITASFALGSTGTTAFGSGGTATVRLAIDRIPRSPSKPGKPTISNVTNNSLRGNLASAPANNGASIIEYGWQFENVDTGGTATATTSGRTWNLTGRAANTRYRVRVRARNSVGWGPYSDWSSTVTTKVNPPAAPTNVSATRVNDNRQTIAWSRHATSAAPYASQRVQRRRWLPGEWTAWTTIATVSGSASSFTDTTTAANNTYRYRVQAVNATGSSTSDQTDECRTTPGAPTNVVAKKEGDDIVVTYERSTPYGGWVDHIVQDNPGGAGWVTVGTVSGSGEFIDQEVNPAVSHQYRVRTVDTLPSGLLSPWSAGSNIVQLLAPPLAPTPLAPMGTMDRDEPFVFRWRHNPVDTTDQTEFELEWWLSYQPANPVTVTGGSEQEVSQSPLGSTNSFSWRVRTKGEYAGANPWSPWSPTQTFNLASRPEVVIQTPEAVLDESQVEVVWGYQNIDASGQSRWEAQLLDAEDNILATGSGSNTATSHLFPTILEDSTTYTVRVRARAGSGLWSEWDTSTFVTDFPLPYPVVVLPEWDIETGSVSLTFDVDDSDATEQAPDSVDVQRDDGDGWITIAVDLDPETSIVDHTPRLGEIRYRTISRTDLPTARTGPETVTEPPRGLWPVFLNGGPDLGDVVAIYDNTALAFDRERAKTRHQWAGRDWPTTKWGQARSKTATLTATISPESPGATMPEIEALEDIPSVVCVRDILGHKIFVTIDSVSSDVERDGRWNVSIPMTREHYIEGVR